MDEKRNVAAQANSLEEAAKQIEINDIDEQLKGCLMGGFNKNSVKAVLEDYRKILKCMQENYNTQLHEVTMERRKAIYESSVLKRQLKDSANKNQNAADLQERFDSLKDTVEEKEERIRELEERLKSALDEGECLKREIPKLRMEKTVLEDENRSLVEEKTNLEEQNKELRSAHDRFAAAKRKTDWNSRMSKDTVKDITYQLESMDVYNEVLERLQTAIECQLESIQTINQELGTITKGFNICKKEVEGYHENEMIMLENKNLGYEEENQLMENNKLIRFTV